MGYTRAATFHGKSGDPSNPEPLEDSAAFRIRWIAREKNRLEDDWHAPKSGSDSANLVHEFVNALCKRIERSN